MSTILESMKLEIGKNRKESILLKLIFYKNIAKPPIVTQHLHDPAPIFQAITHQNTGQNRANVV